MTAKAMEFIKYSVVVLLEEREENFFDYIKLLDGIFSSIGETFEILVIANGTEWLLAPELKKLKSINGKLKAFALNSKTTQAVCLKAALKESDGEIVVACGSYQQISKSSLIRSIKSMDDETDVITPWRERRIDPHFNQLQSKVFNFMVKKITRTNFKDLSCNVKVFRREVIEETRLYGNMYRFLPIIASQKGFKCKEISCEHYQERGKTGFYSLSEYVGRIIDILTLYFTVRFSRKPLRFFSVIGSGFIFAGVILFSYVFVQRLFIGYPLGNHELLLLSVLLVVLGVQAASAGLLGEIVTFIYGRKRREYTIDKKI
jgi:hypothetical protein